MWGTQEARNEDSDVRFMGGFWQRVDLAGDSLPEKGGNLGRFLNKVEDFLSCASHFFGASGIGIPEASAIPIADASELMFEIQKDSTLYQNGDANHDGMIDIADVVYLTNYLFLGGPTPDPLWLGDANCDEVVDVADAVYLVNYLFTDGPPPCEP